MAKFKYMWVLVDAKGEPYWEVQELFPIDRQRLWAWSTREKAREAVRHFKNIGTFIEGDHIVKVKWW